MIFRRLKATAAEKFPGFYQKAVQEASKAGAIEEEEDDDE
jgi:hypothetical protein